MTKKDIPENLISLHLAEEDARSRSISLVTESDRLILCVSLIEKVMDLIDLFRQAPSDSEDSKAVQMLAMRVFNDFASCLKLALSGYGQTSVMIGRDILETAFLLDLFSIDPTAIERWRTASTGKQKREFRPDSVRRVLDKHYGHTSEKRREKYKLYCELATHPSMRSADMMRPKPGMDIHMGAFVSHDVLEAILSEFGLLAVQIGEVVDHFIPHTFERAILARAEFHIEKQRWLDEFWPHSD